MSIFGNFAAYINLKGRGEEGDKSSYASVSLKAVVLLEALGALKRRGMMDPRCKVQSANLLLIKIKCTFSRYVSSHFCYSSLLGWK